MVAADISADELRQLMTLRGEDSVNAIRQQYGSVDELCRRLNTNTDNGMVIVNCICPLIYKDVNITVD